MIDVVVLGAGKWAHECWAPLLLEHVDRYHVAAVVDPQPDLARSLAHAFGLPDHTAQPDLTAALSRSPHVRAAIVLASPERHADCILEASAAGLDVLTEKPMVTTARDVRRVADSVAAAGIKVAVVQNYRYQHRIQATRRHLAAGELGALHYAVARFAADYRTPGSWDVGDAHTMPDPLLVEGSIHHLDMIRYLTGRDVLAVTAATINPPGSSFAGDCIGGFLLHLAGGAFALYEATLQAAGTENRWRDELYRLELQHGSIACQGLAVTVCRDGIRTTTEARDRDMFAGHRHIVRAFADWLDGGPPVETTLADNLRSLAVLLAALHSARTGATVAVPDLLTDPLTGLTDGPTDPGASGAPPARPAVSTMPDSPSPGAPVIQSDGGDGRPASGQLP